MTTPDIAMLRAEIAACRVCASALTAGVRPIAQFSATSRVVIIGQAPGARVHVSGIAWDDPSGRRLREWTGLTPDLFYDPEVVALLPMGFCYPGTGASGDLPPRPECAPLWHDRVLAALPDDRLVLLVGGYAQARYLPGTRALTLTQRVRARGDDGSPFFSLPHPSWRSTGWMARNPWFETDVLPALRARVRASLAG